MSAFYGPFLDCLQSILSLTGIISEKVSEDVASSFDIHGEFLISLVDIIEIGFNKALGRQFLCRLLCLGNKAC